MVQNKSQDLSSSGEMAGLMRRLWNYITVGMIAFKWQLIEMFTKHRKLIQKTSGSYANDVVVITGGARGIGFEVVKQLLDLDMHVILGVRKTSAGHEAITKIRSQGISTGSYDIFELDLTLISSVEQFAQNVLLKSTPIHVLINNSGIMFAPYAVTQDGYESHFQTNYLGHFLLTNLLLPRLIETGRPNKMSRIVNVSSVAHYGGKINFNDLQMTKFYCNKMAYMSTKMMQIISSIDLNNRLVEAGKNVRAYSVHPGIVKTDLYQNICIARACSCFLSLAFKTPSQGADGIVYTALSPELAEGGQFLCNCKVTQPSSKVFDIGTQKKLWTVSCELLKIDEVDLSNLPLKSPSPALSNNDIMLNLN